MLAIWYVILPLNISAVADCNKQFQKRYHEVHGEPSSQSSAKQNRPSGSKITTLLRELSDDESSGDESHPAAAASDPKKPWLKEYNQYIDGWDELAKGQSIVQWWGVRII